MSRLIYFLAVLAVFLIWNYLIIKKRSPKHGVQVVWRLLAWILGASIFCEDDWKIFLIYLVAFHLAFWFPFDLLLNLLNGKPWGYIGETAWLDKQGRKWPTMFIQVKFLLFLMGIGLLICPTGC